MVGKQWKALARRQGRTAGLVTVRRKASYLENSNTRMVSQQLEERKEEHNENR